jgi:hypothetical protein
MLWQFSTGYCRCWQSIGILGMHRFHMKTLTVRSGGYPDFFPSENETALEHWNGGAIVILNWITIYLIHWITIVLLIVILPMVVINQPIRVLVMFISMDWCEGESAGHPFFLVEKKSMVFCRFSPKPIHWRLRTHQNLVELSEVESAIFDGCFRHWVRLYHSDFMPSPWLQAVEVIPPQCGYQKRVAYWLKITFCELFLLIERCFESV